MPPRILILMLALPLFCAVGPVQAAAQSCSTRPPPPTVTVRTAGTDVLASEDLSFSELTRLFRKPGAHPAGLYTGAIAVGQSARYRWVNDGREICVSMDTIEVTLTLTEPKIYIGRELADDACARESVWRHEIVHYRIDQDVLQRFAPIMQRAVEFAAKQTGGQVARREADVTRIGERMARAVRQHVDRVSRDMQSDRDSLHDRLDSREEYARTSAVCSRGDLGNSRPVLCASEPHLCTNLEKP
ncbi:hypothetical protein JL100_020990 [Skermanella mucosa]|uniref:hypothetical protein n=1 Tax=Skermanella mucosa TaxID=1789672 RepID=UPI00192B394B|nr:hypothetical protein [Skermanella mucosa]UEM19547.1 hypothetical protein JL100_020990 [Skermanella mucosa]